MQATTYGSTEWKFGSIKASTAETFVKHVRSAVARCSSECFRNLWSPKSCLLHLQDPFQQNLNRALASLGRGPLAVPFVDAVALLPDQYLAPSVPSFEYPRREAEVAAHIGWRGVGKLKRRRG
jgi:hypothetical protein